MLFQFLVRLGIIIAIVADVATSAVDTIVAVDAIISTAGALVVVTV